MVYARRTNYRRRPSSYKKKPWYQKKYNAMEIATKAAKGVWYLKGLVNSEMMHVQGDSSTTCSNTGTIVHLTPIAQNDTSSGRTGNSVFIRNILTRFWFLKNDANDFTSCRVIFFVDTQQVGDTAPTVANVLESTSTLSPLNTANAGRFKVLKNYEFLLDTTRPSRELKYFSNMRHHVRYNGTANTDIQKGGIYMLALTSDAANPAAFAYNYKLGYHDN